MNKPRFRKDGYAADARNLVSLGEAIREDERLPEDERDSLAVEAGLLASRLITLRLRTDKKGAR